MTKKRSPFTKDAAHALLIEQLKATHATEVEELKAAHKKELQKSVEEMWRQRTKYEDEHVRLLDTTVERDAARVLSDHFRHRLGAEYRRTLENGFRRAQNDPNFAVLRDLIHAGTKIETVDFMGLAAANREATIFGLVMVAEELGYHVKMDVESRKAMEEQKANTWTINMQTRVLDTFVKKVEPKS